VLLDGVLARRCYYADGRRVAGRAEPMVSITLRDPEAGAAWAGYMEEALMRRFKAAYAAMADLTRGVCDRTCSDPGPYRCCEAMYCSLAIEYAKSEGVKLRRTAHPLPLMGEDGRCTAPAHLRPICSAHQCDINSLGFFKPRDGILSADEAFKLTDRYFALRAKASADCDIDSQYEG